MNIIIFGGTGFFGKAFIAEIKKRENINLFIVVRKHKDRDITRQYFHYDDGDAFLNNGKTYDLAIDFASHVSVDDFLMDPQGAFLDNLKIPINNIKFLNNLSFVGKYFYVSTDRAILDISNADSIANVKILNDPYGASKLVGEIIVRYCSSLRGGSATIVRFPNIYGPGQTSRQLIPTILEKLDRGIDIIELASVTGRRNYLFISDAVNALIKLTRRSCNESEVCVSGENVTIKNILDSFEKICLDKGGKQVKFIAKTSKSTRSSYKPPPETLDDLSFRENYDWQPLVNIEQGIFLTLKQEKLYEYKK
jgi:nucleoside-diphosphate-sugar epimerase